MSIKQIFKSKKGIALETAILFLIIIFSFCAMLTSMSIIGHYQAKIEKNNFLNYVELEQIGEDYLSFLRSGKTEFFVGNEKYGCEIRENALCVWLKNDDEKAVILYVDAEYTDGQMHIYEWSYSLPGQTE